MAGQRKGWNEVHVQSKRLKMDLGIKVGTGRCGGGRYGGGHYGGGRYGGGQYGGALQKGWTLRRNHMTLITRLNIDGFFEMPLMECIGGIWL
jgi:hypothetical protein